MNYNRTTRIERMMSRGENLIVKQTGIELQKEPVVMNEEKYVYVSPFAVLHLQFWAYGSWDLLFSISMSQTANL